MGVEGWAFPAHLGFLAGSGVAPEALRAALEDSRRLRVPPDRVLRAGGLLSDEAFYWALARDLDVPFLARPLFIADPRTPYPMCLTAGIVPARPDNPFGLRFLLAPEGDLLARLMARRREDGLDGVAVTTPSTLRACVDGSLAPRLQHLGAHALAETDADGSARDGLSQTQRRVLATGAAVARSAGVVAAPAATATVLAALFFLVFAAHVLLRLGSLISALLRYDEVGPAPPLSDADLPVYTVMVPLYREGRVLPKLVAAIRALDYPAAKLDVKIILEEDDHETAAAAACLRLPGTFDIVRVPRGHPRTKPRALNVAVASARGEFCVVYDAEDEPEPDQLRRAAAAFRRLPRTTACLQGRLCIDNTGDSWLARLFTIEYAMLFDVIVPGTARLDLPIMLGGTTNHFRVAALRIAGAWDAWNVTEDADLGLRLARHGYRVDDLPSTTYEEAPVYLRQWLSQRTRWQKGWMQTLATHTRRPARHLRELGVIAYAASVANCAGTIATALVGPLLFGWAAWDIWTGRLAGEGGAWPFVAACAAMALFAVGLATTIATALAGLARRRLWRLAPWLLLMPVYLALGSIAAWRGLYELVRAPQQWNKTEHGLAKSSRRRDRAQGAEPARG